MTNKNKPNLAERLKNIPFTPSKFPFFYGWIILFAGVVGVLMSIPGQTMGVSVFTDYLLEALHLSRIELSVAYMIGTVMSALFITRAGRLYDRHGARPIAVVVAIMLGVSLLYLSKVDTVSAFFDNLLHLQKSTLVTMILITLGFFLIRFFGQGVLTMISRNMVMKWFDKRRGLVNAILGVSISFGFAYSPRLLNDMIEQFTWRGAWQILALVSAVFFIIFAFVFFRDNPHMYGLIPDGKKIVRKRADVKGDSTGVDQTLKEARRTYNFWMFNLGMAMYALYITAITFHIVSVFGVNGFSREVAVAIFLPTALVAVGFHFGGSWLSDYIRLKYLLWLFLAGMCLSMFALTRLDIDPVYKWLIIIGNGIAQGMFGVMSAVAWPRFFGLRHLGEISGYAMGWTVTGSAVGPSLFSLSLKYTGSYDMAGWILFVITFVLLVMSLRIKRVVAAT